MTADPRYRTFDAADQLAFARLSGDWNPLHIDPVAARRSLFGRAVVHGIHALLWGLDRWLAEIPGAIELRSLTAAFSKPIPVGERVGWSLDDAGDGRAAIRLTCGGGTAATITLAWRDAERVESDAILAEVPERLEPRALSAEEVARDSGTLGLYLEPAGALNLFPHLSQRLAPIQAAILLATTRLVGVVCPGRDSLYAELSLSAASAPPRDGLAYAVTRCDTRVGLVMMDLTAPGMAGTVKAFLRPQPRRQADYAALKKQVTEGEFGGQRALVVGGSRGLGEVVAKLLAAGGADVRITYHHGQADARRIVDEVVAHGGRAAAYHCDVLDLQAGLRAITAGGWVPTDLYYFATPHIFSGVRGEFSVDLFRSFADYYVLGFAGAVAWLRPLGIRGLFFPSTVAIDELPLDMGEYAAAKLAGESTCAFLRKAVKGVRVHAPRIPRVATDQTLTIMPLKNADPVPIMLRELRAFRDLPADP